MLGADQRGRIQALHVADFHVGDVARGQVQRLGTGFGDDQRALAQALLFAYKYSF